MLFQSLGDRISVFAEERGAQGSADFPESLVVTSLNAGVVGGGIHDIGFHENDGAIVEAVGEEVACPEVRVAGDLADIGRARRIKIGGQSAFFRKSIGDACSNAGFLLMGALEKFLEKGETLVGEDDLLVIVGPVEKEVKVAAVDEGWVVRVTPGFGVEMEAEDEVGF